MLIINRRAGFSNTAGFASGRGFSRFYSFGFGVRALGFIGRTSWQNQVSRKSLTGGSFCLGLVGTLRAEGPGLQPTVF